MHELIGSEDRPAHADNCRSLNCMVSADVDTINWHGIAANSWCLSLFKYYITDTTVLVDSLTHYYCASFLLTHYYYVFFLLTHYHCVTERVQSVEWSQTLWHRVSTGSRKRQIKFLSSIITNLRSGRTFTLSNAFTYFFLCNKCSVGKYRCV